jgi:CheY-like chemotaxis protein
MTYTVLIVDDSKLARMAAIRALGACRPGWPYLEAGSAADALTAVERGAPDIALVDVNMPGTDGLSLVEDLRDVSPALEIAVVSANSQQEVVNRAQALGAAFLPKPLAENALREFLDASENRIEAEAS